MDVSPAELKDILLSDRRLREYCRAAGAELQHMNPHGILYTMIEKRRTRRWSTAIGEASRNRARS